jgi:hypothetical protein
MEAVISQKPKNQSDFHFLFFFHVFFHFQVLYLFGGWDGNRDLADFWAFDISSGKWRLLSLNTEADGGPSPRSCHKMVFDPKTRQIFILGRYLERGLRDRAQNIKVFRIQ